MKKIFSLLLIITLFTACQGQTSKSVEVIDSKTFADKLKSTENPQLLDVRTPEEFAVDHLENASNVNWNGSEFAAKAEKLDKSKPVFVYCKVGGRSHQAAEKLSELGFTQVYDLQGGIMKWNANGMAVEKKSTDKNVGISTDDYQKLINSDKKVVVNFHAVWCAPCKKMEPYLLKMQQDLKGKTTIIRLDADANKTLVDAMKFDSLPIILIYENGKEVWRNIGYLSEEDLKKHL
jgi:rhodanese-related sulfurtransferase